MKLPLLYDGPNWPTRVLAYEDGQAISAGRLLSAAYAMSKTLPKAPAVLNLAVSRTAFFVGFVAAILRGQVTLMPSSHSAQTLSALRQEYPDLYVLTDDTVHHKAELDLPHLEILTTLGDGEYSMPHIDSEQVVARVFTSGSTGLPTGHDKRFGALRFNAQSQAIRLGLTAEAPACLIATVPVQHMYGFESSFLLAMLAGQCLVSAKPFYPADIAHVLSTCPEPRVLVTTPVHLRVMLESSQTYPRLAALMSATAPLAPVLASAAEARLQAPLYEVYGCTEAGQLATRRTTAGSTWHTYREVVIHTEGEQAYASGGHVEGKVALGDYLLLHDDSHFELLGRHEDMINIAGKRSSLAYLNHHLLSVKGVVDASFYLPEEAGRLLAFVVSDESADHIIKELRTKLDAVFLPRPLYHVAALPRNATGKLTDASLTELYRVCKSKST